MNNIKQKDDASLADFSKGWRTAFADEQGELIVTVTYAVIGLTNFGSTPFRARDWPSSWAGR